MLKFQNNFNHSNNKLLVISFAIMSLLLLLVSCSKEFNTPESSENEISNLYKSNLDSEITSIENYIVKKNVDGEIEIPIRFISSQSLNHVLFVINGDEELWLNTKVVDILEMNGEIAIVHGVEEGTTLLVNPMPTIRELSDYDSENLRYKFRSGRNYCRKHLNDI